MGHQFTCQLCRYVLPAWWLLTGCFLAELPDAGCLWVTKPLVRLTWPMLANGPNWPGIHFSLTLPPLAPMAPTRSIVCIQSLQEIISDCLSQPPSLQTTSDANSIRSRSTSGFPGNALAHLLPPNSHTGIYEVADSLAWYHLERMTLYKFTLQELMVYYYML